MSYVHAVIKSSTSKSSLERLNPYSQKERRFKISSVSTTKYSNNRVNPSTASSTSYEWNRIFKNSNCSIYIKNKPPRRNQTTTTITFPQISKTNRKRDSICYSRTGSIKLYICILCSILFLISIGILLFAILYRPRTSTPTTLMTTTMTTTTYTSTTTSTLTSSTTETTTTSTTSDTTTTTTTDTTTTTACYFGDDYVHLVERGQRQIKNLCIGDRILALSDNGQRLIEDEIMCIPHAGPTSLTDFYTFITNDGHRLSVTGRHYLIVTSTNSQQTNIKSASSITLDDRLILVDHSATIEKIIYSQCIGYLLVNNISTSVYSELFSGTHKFFYQLTGLARVYYHFTRWFFGKKYIPFATSINEEIHPISAFVMNNYEAIRFIFISLSYMIPIMFVSLNIYFIQQFLFLLLKKM